MSETLLGGGEEAATTTTEATTTDAPITDTPATTQEAAPILPQGDLNWDGALNADGTFASKAYENGLDEQWKSVGALQKSYKDLQRMKGAPGAEATPEEIDRFRQANEVPGESSIESYGVQLPEELAGVVSEDSLKGVLEAANGSAHLGHKAMVNAMISKFAEFQSAEIANGEKEHAATLEARRQELFKDPNFAGPNQTGAIQTAKNALAHAADHLGVGIDSPEAIELANNPLAVRMLHYFGSKMGQDNTAGLQAHTDLRSKAEQADDIISNPANPEHAAYHAGDPVIGRKVLRLMGHTE